jgi:acyl-CoA thioester hydrolase
VSDDKAAGQPFTFRLRVYYEDTDAAGVVYYANYLKFMERARTEWLESLGFPLAPFERAHGVAFVVHRVEVDFLLPARLNDTLATTVEVLDRRAASLRLRQTVLRGDELLTRAQVALACVDAQALRPRRIPDPLATALENAD